MGEKIIMPFVEAQFLFLRLCYLMRRANLNVKDSKGKESIIIEYPYEKLNNQFGTIQYGGISYESGLTRELAIRSIEYVEIRFNIDALNDVGLYNDLNIDSKYGFRTEDKAGCIRFRVYHWHIDTLERKELTYKFIDKISKVISDKLEIKYGLDFYLYGLDQGIREMPRIFLVKDKER